MSMIYGLRTISFLKPNKIKITTAAFSFHQASWFFSPH